MTQDIILNGWLRGLAGVIVAAADHHEVSFSMSLTAQQRTNEQYAAVSDCTYAPGTASAGCGDAGLSRWRCWACADPPSPAAADGVPGDDLCYAAAHMKTLKSRANWCANALLFCLTRFLPVSSHMSHGASAHYKCYLILDPVSAAYLA